MEKEEYKKLISTIVPKENKLKNGLIAFIIGGLIGLLAEILVVIFQSKFNLSYKESTSVMMVILIFFASLFTAIGFFDNLVSFAKAGLIVPITGFAHAMTSSIIDYKKEGFVTGIGSNAFKLSGSVILYGVVSAYIFGIVRYLFFGG